MKKPIVAFAVVVAASACFAGQTTFESVQKEFEQKALSLLSEQGASFTGMSYTAFRRKVAELADETFGSHPEVMRKEAEKRFARLPQFPATNLTAYVEHKSDRLPFPPLESGSVWCDYGWDPEKLAREATEYFRIRQIGPERYLGLDVLEVCCPDRVYRVGKGEFPDLVVESLGDLFVIEVEMTEVGVCRPVSIKWMKEKEPQSKP